jgi:O-acetyl-ADP-ribose deacetylase (regulator of RNase III)
MEADFARARLETFQGDITESGTRTIVNAANNHFWMGSGVAGALKRAGGGNIETEAMSLGPVDVGEAVVTRAGNLNADYVIHAAVMGQDLVTSADAVRRATRASLERAGELGVDSIAFPAFGTGVGGFSASVCADVMVATVVDWVSDRKARGDSRLERIVFVLFSEDVKREFDRALECQGR